MSLIRCDNCGKAIDTDFEELESVQNGGTVDFLCQTCAENAILATQESAGSTIYEK